MIDTDKYEGHSKGPWYWDGNLCNDVHSDKHGINQWTVFDWEDGLLAKEVDMQLIADAPLLLEELKRLREEKTFLWETYLKESAEVKRLREQLAKANKYVHTVCQHSDSMLMDYEDYMKGDD